MTFSSASTQLAAFHQPVESHSPLLLYHCNRIWTAASLFPLKSSPARLRVGEPPLSAKIAAYALAAPLTNVKVTLVTALLLLTSGISMPYSLGLPEFRDCMVV